MSSILPSTNRAWHGRVWQLTWPVILANLTIPLVGLADVAVMGQLPDPAYIGAVAAGSTMFNAVYWLFGFLRMSTTGLSAQAYGADQLPQIAAIWLRASCVAATLGVALILAQIPLGNLLLYILEPSNKVADWAMSYYSIRIWGAPGLLIQLVELGLLFGLQRMRDTLLLSVGFNLTNLLLDVLFVMGFGWGVEGVALGTLISEWGAALLGAWLVLRALRQLGWRIALPSDLWLRSQLLQLFSVSGNLVIRTFFVQLPFIAGSALASRLGDVTLATHGILMQLFFVMTYGLDGFAHTAETLAGYTYGARLRSALQRSVRVCALWGGLVALLLGMIYWFGGPVFIDQLTVSEPVRALASDYLAWMAIAPLLCIWPFLLDGVFIGTTHIRPMRNAMLISALIWAVCLWLTFDRWQYHGVWFAMMVFMCARGALLTLHYPRLLRDCQPVATNQGNTAQHVEPT